MAELSLSKIGRTAKMAVIGAVKGTGDIAESVLGATKDVLMVTVGGAAEVAVAAGKTVG